MKGKTYSALALATMILGFSGAAGAKLIDRGGGLIYDDVLNITWLQDANYAKTSGYDANGAMTWDQAVAWADQLNYYDSVRNVTWSDWRLPIIAPARASYTFGNNGTATGGYGATGAGYGTATPSGGWGPTGDADGIWSELGWMYYHNLSNLGRCTPNGGGSSTSCDVQTGWDLTHTSTPDGVAIQNLRPDWYWSGTEYAPRTGDAWHFDAYFGYQDADLKDYGCSTSITF